MSDLSFEKLNVYRLSEKLSDEIWFIVKDWNHFEKDTIEKQFVRSADSIGANIAEGTGKRSIQDNRRFIRIARGSLFETIHWMRRAYKRKLFTSKDVNQLKEIIDELIPKLNACLNSIGKNVIVKE